MPNRPPLSPAQVDQFNRDGYLIVPGLLDAEEADLLVQTAKADELLLGRSKSTWGIADAAGRTSKMFLWNHPSDDIYGTIARSNRMVGSMEQLLGGGGHHYHSKTMLKEPPSAARLNGTRTTATGTATAASFLIWPVA